jgi:UDPglucose 6-dehydrogenase
MRLGVVGGGIVGRATARAFVEFVDEVRVYDVVRERATHPLADVLACDLVFCCLPTPQKEGSLECDLSAVEGFFASVAGSKADFVLRSTVPVGTTARLAARHRLRICHSPEFLSARCAVTDAHLPARNVVGWVRPPAHDAAALVALYERRFPGVPVHLMTSCESEAVKLAQNSFFSTKLAFFNELRSFCEAKSLRWDAVLPALLADGRVSHSHTQVPGPDGRFGFGGACLPKDLANFVACVEAAGLSAAVSRAAHERNLEDRRRAV